MQTVVITGSTRGIGLGLAREFLGRGMKVTISGRSPGSVDQALGELKEFGDNVHGIPCVVTDHAQVQALWDGAKQHWGSVDCWISNAGIVNDQVASSQSSTPW